MAKKRRVEGWKQRLSNDPTVRLAQQAMSNRTDLTVTEISRRSGLAVSTVTNLDNGKTRYPQGMTVYCILRACGVKLTTEKG